MKSGSTSRPRPGGGFNAGMGQFGEHLDEEAMKKAMSNKGSQQQGASTSGLPSASSVTKQSSGPLSLTDELLKNPLKDMGNSLKSLADLNTWMGIKPSEEDAQERAHKEIMLKNFNKLTDEEQAVAKQRYQERMKKLQAEEEEKERQKQLKAQQAQESLNMPASPQKGPIGPGMSGSQKAKAQLDWDRQRLSGPANVG